VSIGFIYNLANVVDGPGDTGLLLGEPTREDFSILINFGINFGAKPTVDSQGLGPAGIASPQPPPNYFTL
jgi:hypothetical protein